MKVTQLCPTLANARTVAHQAPLSMEFSRQQYCSGKGKGRGFWTDAQEKEEEASAGSQGRPVLIRIPGKQTPAQSLQCERFFLARIVNKEIGTFKKQANLNQQLQIHNKPIIQWSASD